MKLQVELLCIACKSILGWILNKKIGDGQIIQVTLQKCPDRVSRSIDYRLFMHIEACVNQCWNAAKLVVFLHNTIIAWITFFADQLRPGSPIHVHRSGRLALHLIRAIESYRHELRGVFGAADIFVAGITLFI